MRVEFHGPFAELGAAIRHARNARNLTQVELGAALGLPTYVKGRRMPEGEAHKGVSCPAASALERVKTSTVHLADLARVLRVHWVCTPQGWGWTAQGRLTEQCELDFETDALPSREDIVRRRLDELGL